MLQTSASAPQTHLSMALGVTLALACQPPMPIVSPSPTTPVNSPLASGGAETESPESAEASVPDGACRAFTSIEEACSTWVAALSSDWKVKPSSPDLACEVETRQVTREVSLHRLTINQLHDCQLGVAGSWQDVGSVLIPTSREDSHEFTCRAASDRLTLVLVESDGLWALELERGYAAPNDSNHSVSFTLEHYIDHELTYSLTKSFRDTHHEAPSGNLEGERVYGHLRLTPFGPVPKAFYLAGSLLHAYRSRDECSDEASSEPEEGDPWRCYDFVEDEFQSSVAFEDECELQVQTTQRTRVAPQTAWQLAEPESEAVAMCCEPECEAPPRCAEEVWTTPDWDIERLPE